MTKPYTYTVEDFVRMQFGRLAASEALYSEEALNVAFRWCETPQGHEFWFGAFEGGIAGKHIQPLEEMIEAYDRLHPEKAGE